MVNQQVPFKKFRSKTQPRKRSEAPVTRSRSVPNGSKRKVHFVEEDAAAAGGRVFGDASSLMARLAPNIGFVEDSDSENEPNAAAQTTDRICLYGASNGREMARESRSQPPSVRGRAALTSPVPLGRPRSLSSSRRVSAPVPRNILSGVRSPSGSHRERERTGAVNREEKKGWLARRLVRAGAGGDR